MTRSLSALTDSSSARYRRLPRLQEPRLQDSNRSRNDADRAIELTAMLALLTAGFLVVGAALRFGVLTRLLSTLHRRRMRSSRSAPK